MKITNKTIKNLKPCQDRLDNYLEHYKGKSHSLKQFLKLKGITHNDKMWVAFRLMPKENMSLCAADIAESVLHIFEAKYPNDLRPRQAIEAVRNKKISADACAYYAYNAADAARAASDAAYATVYAYATASDAANAANAANAAAYAAYAAASNAAAFAASDAASDAAYAVYAYAAKVKQQEINLKIIVKYLE